MSFNGLPASDPVRSMIDAIIEIVPVSKWSFTRLKEGAGVASPSPLSGAVEDAGRDVQEMNAKRLRQGAGPSIRATVGPSGYTSGLALVFADSQAQFGVLSLLRKSDMGIFSSSEIRALTFALDAASDRLSELRLMESQDAGLEGFRVSGARGAGEEMAAEDATAQYLLNRNLDIVLAWTSENVRRVAVTPLCVPIHSRLPFIIQEAVRQLTRAWTDDSASQVTGLAKPSPFLVVRTRPMSGPTGLFIGVTVERRVPGRSLTDAAARFSISPREIQVLALLLDGLRLNEVARRLHITSSTVQDHIKHLLEKTGSHNRHEMSAKILGWDAANLPGGEKPL
jgi:DNA-binding CsgD family transcriptional regulator